jgi:serine/threonine-protein kinase
MSQPYVLNRKAGPPASQDVTEVAARPVARKRCPVALLTGTGPALTQEIGCLLRRRLLLAALITGAGFTIFFVRNLLGGPGGWHTHGLDKLLQGSMAALFVLFAVVLGSRLPLTVRQLRALELLLFGSAALYFGWLHLTFLSRHAVLDWAREDHRGDVLRLANASNTLRWFVLITIYGVFVPNTWRRCAAFIAVLALTPLAITSLMLARCPYLGEYLWPSLFDMATLLGIGSAIAIFGSYKISELRQEAYEARQLGQYRLTRRLGGGGMGEVYLGEHVLLRRACAIKLIRPDQAGDPTALQRFEREVQSMATLTHWNTVEVFDYGHADDGTFYYVMEYLPGLSLHDLVARYGPLSAARAVHFLRQVCAGLAEAHSIGLIHRDIKPSNVLATTRGGVRDVAKVLDFGLVQCMAVPVGDDKLTVQGTILGSPPFMSPEQAQGKAQLDARTDIYSVGALAYFLLTGQAPFVRETTMQTLMAHVYEKVTPPSALRPEIPADLEAVVLRCLEKDPAKRFPDAESLDEALARCACAGQWTRREAVAWWQSRHAQEPPAVPETPPADSPVVGSYQRVLPAADEVASGVQL